MPHQDPEDPLDPLDPLAKPESMDHLVNLVPLPYPHHLNLEMLAQLEMPVQRDPLDPLVLLEPMANLARKDPLDLLEKMEHPARTVNKEQVAHPDPLDHLANGESARNTALWMVEFSSKTEHGGKRPGARLYIKIEKGYVQKIIYRSFFNNVSYFILSFFFSSVVKKKFAIID